MSGELKSILITGGTGFLGSAVLRRLVERGHRVILLKRSFSDIRRIKDVYHRVTAYDVDLTPCETIFRAEKIDVILHCATNYGRRNADPLQIIESNLLLPLRLLELAREQKVSCFINTDTILDTRVSRYAMSKSQFREWLRSYQDSLACVNVALEHFYGPNDDPSKFVSFVVEKCLARVPVIDLTGGAQERDFVYIDDVVEAFMRIIAEVDSMSGYREFQVGSNKPLTIKSLVMLVKRLTKNQVTRLNFGAIPYRQNETMRCVADIKDLTRLGWNPTISIEDGLMRMIAESNASSRKG